MRVGKLGLAIGLVTSLVGGALLVAEEPASKVKPGATLKAAPSTLAALQKPRKARVAGTGSPSNIDAYFDGATKYSVLNVEFDSPESCQKFNLPQTKLITRHQRWAQFFTPVDDRIIDGVKNHPGVVIVEEVERGLLPPPARPVPRKEASRSVADLVVQGGIADPSDPKGQKKLTGKGVIVAIIDSGLDYTHPDFLTYDAQRLPTSRCLYFWDTTSDAYANGVGEPSEYKYPSDAAIGTVYDRKTLTAEIRSGNLRIPSWDSDGHGTACAGVAGGNGNALRIFRSATSKPGETAKQGAGNEGVAPDVDLIGIRLGGRGLENGFMLNAICEWLDKVAGNRPLVISCSFGGHYAGHDGYTVEERHLSSRFPPEKKSRAIVVSAGNEGEDPFHANITLGTQENPATLAWVAGTPPPRMPRIIDIYVQTDKVDDVQVPIGDGQMAPVVLNPLSNHSVISLNVPAGEFSLPLYSISGSPYKADAYFRNGQTYYCEFKAEGGQSFQHQVGTPGSAHNVLTIGSYDWNDQFEMHGGTRTLKDVDRQGDEVAMNVGAISSYSSPGPLRFGDVVKPEIVAPGRWYSAPASRNVTTTFDRDSTGQYTLHNGTSAAAPYAAGVIALLFEAKKTMTWGEVRKVLTESATQDAITGDCPNPQWGHGKLDYPAVERAVKKVKAK